MEQKKTRVVRIHEEYRKKKESEAFEAAFGSGSGDGGLTQEDRAVLAEAAAVLREGGLVAFPTETVYGLGANGLDPEAVEHIFQAKGRPQDNPLILHVPDDSWLDRYCQDIPPTAYELTRRFWPGPLTLILPRRGIVPDVVTAGMDTVGMRCPDHPVTRAILELADVPVAAPSANTSGKPSPTTAAHVLADMDGKIDAVVDGGPCSVGVESTIVDLTEEIPTILRPGYISLEMVQAVLGEAKMDKGLISSDSNIHPKAPGMKYRHYAPKADLKIVEGPVEKVVAYINEKAKAGKVGIICTEETKDRYPAGDVKCIGSRKSELSIASHLFAVLREFDEDGVDAIYSESFQAPGLGEAIMNRLLKAAGHQRVDVSDRI